MWKVMSVAALICSVAGQAAARGSSTTTRCEVAEAALAQSGSAAEEALFSTSAPASISSTLRGLTAADFAGNWEGQSPPMALFARFKSSLATSALNCSGVQRAAEQRGDVVSEAQGDERIRALKLEANRTVYFYSLSLPAVDSTGRHAVAAVVRSSNRLAGGVRLLHLTRTAEGWRIAGTKVVLIS